MDFCPFLKTWVKVYAITTVKNFLIGLKKSTTDAMKTASKGAIQKTAEATGDLTGNKIANKITRVLKKKTAKELHNNDEDVEISTQKKRYISPEGRQQIIDKLRLVPKTYV